MQLVGHPEHAREAGENSPRARGQQPLGLEIQNNSMYRKDSVCVMSASCGQARCRACVVSPPSQPVSQPASQPVSRKHGKPDIWPAHGQCVRQRSGVGPPRRESGAVRSRKPTSPAAALHRRNRKRARRGRPYMDASHSVVHCQPAFASVVGHSCRSRARFTEPVLSSGPF